MTGPWCGADGATLRPDTPHTLTDGTRRWPVVDDVAWLRAGDDDLRERAVAELDRGDVDGAAALLFADADEWWDQRAPSNARLRRVRHTRTLREAVDLLGLGRVGTYFLHRWSDPTWLATLALTAAHPPAGRPVVDIACGAGHLLRHLAQHGHDDLLGVDVVFAKLWLARRHLVPRRVRLVCADAQAAWPDPAGGPRYVCCHDALYFLEHKAAVLTAARRHAGGQGAVVVGHGHNALHPAGRSGRPLPGPQWADLLPGSRAYTEEELTAAALDGRLPRVAEPAELAGTEAVGLVDDPAGAPGETRLLYPPPHARLRPNPLYTGPLRHWPGDAWAAEYGERAAAYLPALWTAYEDPVRRRMLVDIPETW
ncbi:methyltransferase family protein [Pseudonocardia sediminis]|uniref:Methyltransferase family protein n=1 Tax=Pseudonocardia sediminis TaxID=1397368 RepID=A0A4Q7UV89_PSEST|nr:class I SAM-dependent methyltransferase [Pseudonocardia sediminis]RZT85706.1 methyltransferase family protein [Pseudonocardia sediminis]